MHQSIPPAPSTPPPPPPPPELLRGVFPPCQSRGWGICNFYTALGPGICQPRGHSQAFDTHAVSYKNITTQNLRRFYWKKRQIRSSVKDRDKLKRFVKACSRFYACIFSLLIKPELHGETWELSVWIIVFLVIESSFSWYYLKNILSCL